MMQKDAKDFDNSWYIRKPHHTYLARSNKKF
jgi:hypothetical protein